MAGVAPLTGFVAKESVLGALLGGIEDAGAAPGGLGMARSGRRRHRVGPDRRLHGAVQWGAFATKPDVRPPGSRCRIPGFVTAPLLLGVASLFLGLLAPIESTWLMPYADLFTVGDQPEPLALWHGLTAPLALSLFSIIAGALLFLAREDVARPRPGSPTSSTASASSVASCGAWTGARSRPPR